MSPIFYAVVKAYTQDEFDSLMDKVEKIDIRVKDYLELARRDKWARLYAPVNRGWTLTSNIAECINSKLVASQELPIFDLVEEVRKLFGRWNFNNRRNGIYTFTTLGRKFQELLSINEHLCSRMTVEPSTEYLCTVNDERMCFIVCLEKKLIYDVPVCPLLDESEWKIPNFISDEVVLLLRYKRPTGRSKKKRDKPLLEIYLCLTKCGYCNLEIQLYTIVYSR
ncbi:uncharacterized protein LOC132628756 [Lycium barbarum]|uniref:uncharacterized protein LOC132628756 n=1 Tax=Lycium barbarum TaxID=112863 RepID=UPI00293EA496|nr:uncharacterized protein LOC132628756 [Lycium barbarum]